MKYAVVDWYEDPDGEILGIELTKEDANALATQRIEDTDGECDVQIYDNEIDYNIYSELYDRVFT